jgi:AraC-like DNA-binding protein
VSSGSGFAPGAAELRRQVARLADGWPGSRTVDGITVLSTPRTTAPLGSVAEPVVALVAQGAKRAVLGDDVFDYAAGQFLVVTVDLPLASNITAASATWPFLGLGVPLDRAIIAELILESDLRPLAAPPGPALAVSDAAPELIDAFVRLLRLVGAPHDQRILGPAVTREIHWRLLTGPQGGLVRQIGIAGSRIALVAQAIAWIRAHYDEPLRIDCLAAEVGLSVSSLNRHFRSATSMSPLQYQKQLRLQQARLRLLANPADVAGTGHAVGYTSASQFSREYRRMFGASPGRDAVQLQNASLGPSWRKPRPGAGEAADGLAPGALDWLPGSARSTQAALTEATIPARGVSSDAEKGADHLGDKGVVVGLGQAGYGDRADNAHVPDADREGAAVRREQARLDPQRLVKRGPARRQPSPHQVGGCREPVDHVDLALDPGVVLGRGAGQGCVEQLLAVAPYVDRDRQFPFGRGRDHGAAEPPRVRVVEPGEYQPGLLRFERGDQCLLIAVHAARRAWARTVSIVAMTEIVSSSGISGLSSSPAASRRATSSAWWRRPLPSCRDSTRTGSPFRGMSVTVAGA